MLLLLAACSAEPPAPAAPKPAGPIAAPAAALTWVDGRRICDLGVARLTGDDGAYEASGVTLHDGRLWVVFDNSGLLLSVAPDLSEAALVGEERSGDHEAITATGAGLLVGDEAGLARPFDGTRYQDAQRIVAAVSGNKGIEGLAWAACQETLLALCEEGCGDSPLLALKHRDGQWMGPEVPLSADLKDFAGLALHGEGACPSTYTMAVLSQKSSAVWIGALSFDGVSWQAGEGEVLPLPRTEAGKKLFTTAEGIAFLSADRLAVVTDAEDDQPPCGPAQRPPTDRDQADQSIHIFQR